MDLVLLLVFAVLVVAVAIGVVVVLRAQQTAVLDDLRQRSSEQTSEQQQAAIAAAVTAALAERGNVSEALANERHQTVAQIVEKVTHHAGQALDARLQVSKQLLESQLQAGQQELGHKLEVGGKDLEARSESFREQTQLLEAGLQKVGLMVQSLQKEGTAQKRELLASIQASDRSTRELHHTTSQLREAFANPKARGQWGERMADDVLQRAGFIDGVNYVKQVALPSGGIPDVTFLLPRQMRLHMDAKFPLDNYAKFLEATDDRNKDAAAKQFRSDVRTRVKELAARNYTDGDDTVDCVLLFIPNEAVYNFLHENDPDIIDVALAKQVVLCSPFTLFSVLAVVRQSVENFKLTQRSSEILTELGRFREEWARFTTQLEKVDKQMNTLYGSFENLTTTRVNKMVKTLDRIDRLQAGEADELVDLSDLTTEVAAPAPVPTQQRLAPVIDDTEIRDIAG